MNLIWTPAQLAMLAKVVDLNGFSAAARALGVPKAAVSRAVADLESTLGVRVLERTTRRIALTAAGRLLYPHARRVGEETDAARSAIAKLQSPEARPLRVVADPTYGRVLLSPLVPRFLEAFAQVPLEVALDAEQLAGGDWDVAIRTRPPAGCQRSAAPARRAAGAAVRDAGLSAAARHSRASRRAAQRTICSPPMRPSCRSFACSSRAARSAPKCRSPRSSRSMTRRCCTPRPRRDWALGCCRNFCAGRDLRPGA